MRRLQQLLEWTAGSLLFALLVVGALQVTSRYTGLIFVPWTEEVARLLFVWVVWIGAAAAAFRGSHIRFDFLVERLPRSMRAGVERRPSSRSPRRCTRMPPERTLASLAKYLP